MTKEKIKQVMDACYQAKRVRDMMPKLPNGVTPTHIHYLDVITRFERSETDVKVSDISDEAGAPQERAYKTIKDMDAWDLWKEGFRGGWTFCVYQEHSGWQRSGWQIC